MKYAVLLLTLLATISCTRIVFEEPQPADTAALKTFPAKFQGRYVHPDDVTDTLIVEATTVTFMEYRSTELPLVALGSMENISLRDGLLYDADDPQREGVPYMIEDSVLKYTVVSREVLGLSDSVVIKTLDDLLVMNMRDTKDEVVLWDVVTAQFTKSGNLMVSINANLRTPDTTDDSDTVGDIEDFAKITPYERVREDVYLFRPTKAQFKQLVGNGLFSDTTSLHRVME